jgi:hypothetical protein
MIIVLAADYGFSVWFVKEDYMISYRRSIRFDRMPFSVLPDWYSEIAQGRKAAAARGLRSLLVIVSYFPQPLYASPEWITLSFDDLIPGTQYQAGAEFETSFFEIAVSVSPFLPELGAAQVRPVKSQRSTAW